MKNKMITHRCEGSLKHGVSIRYAKAFKHISQDEDYKTWRLFQLEYDEYFDNHYLKHIAPINICPFCGEDLREVEIDDKFAKNKDFIENNNFKIVDIQSTLYNSNSSTKNIGLAGKVVDFNEEEPFSFYCIEEEKLVKSGSVKDFKIEDDLLIIDATYYTYVLKIIKDLD